MLVGPADSALRRVQADHEAAEKQLGELRAEQERVTRQVRFLCARVRSVVRGRSHVRACPPDRVCFQGGHAL